MKYKWDKIYLYAGVTAFCVLAASLLFYFIFSRYEDVKRVISAAWQAMLPIVYGLAIAYLLSPVSAWLERVLFKPLFGRMMKKKPQRVAGAARGCSVFGALLFAFLLVSGLLYLVLPQLGSSLQMLVTSLPEYVTHVTNWITRKLDAYPAIQNSLLSVINGFSSNLTSTISNTLLPKISDILAGISTSVIAVVNTIINIFMGVVVSIYLLASREKFLAQTKKLIYAIFRPAFANSLLKNASLTHRMFGGFITAKLLDSLIVGVVAYLVMLILQIPYTALIAVVIGVTNIIPIFGPIIGAVPCALLVLMVSPIKCLIFVVFVVVLQQLDGNVLGPMLLGNNTGLSGFWVIVALLIGRWLFGFVGMIIAVPLFAVVYTLIRSACDRKLQEKELPVATADYQDLASIDPNTREPAYLPKESLSLSEKAKARLNKHTSSQPPEDVSDEGKK